uniref:Uncharacterized protein n=1 Tax=Bracon brevicornis TaxID=1563983 RepID=A0A6V7J724_9HYME
MEQIKIKLMSRDELAQISGLKLIKHELSQLPANQKLKYIDFLLQNNIGHTLCDIMPTRNQELLELITSVYKEFAISRNFYDNGTAWEAIMKITTITDFIRKNDNQSFQEIIDRLFISLCEILDKAANLMLILSNYFDMNKIFEYFFASNVLERRNRELITKSIKFFRIILPYFKITPIDCKRTVHMLKKHCSYIKWMFRQSRKSQLCSLDPTLKITLLYSCEMTLEVLAFCYRVTNNPENYASLSGQSDYYSALIKYAGREVNDFLTKSAIPSWLLLKDTIETSRYRTNLEPLVVTINTLHDLSILGRRDTSKLMLTMASSDCVKFIRRYTESTAGKLDSTYLEMIRLLSKILAHWAAVEKMLIGQQVGEKEDFESYLCGELTKSFEMHSLEQRPIAYHLLIYYESQSGLEKWKCPFDITVRTILETPNDVLTSNLPLVKVLWFFMSHFINFEGQRPHNASEAASKLFSIIKTRGVENCFTGCPEMVAFTLLNPIAYTIKMKVVEKWIENSTDIDPLQLDKTHRPLVHCLWKMLMNVPNCLLKKVEAAIKSGLSSSAKFCKSFDDLLIDNLPSILATFDPAIETRFLTIIHLWSRRFIHLNLPKNFVFVCASNIVRIVMEHSSNSLIRRPMLRFLRDMLLLCRENSDFKGVKIFITHSKMIRTLYTHLPSNLGDIRWLMGIFATLLQFQRDNPDLKSTESITIKPDEVMRDLINCPGIMCNKSLVFWTLLFSGSIRKPIFKISESINETAMTPLIFYVFKEVLSLKKPSIDQQPAMVYQCLTAIFEYCRRKRFTKLLNKLCDSPEMVHFIDEKLYSGEHCELFYVFVAKWLEISLSIPTKTCQRLIEPRDIIGDHWHVVSPLERVIIKLQCLSQRALSKNSHVNPSIVDDLNVIIENFSINLRDADAI